MEKAKIKSCPCCGRTPSIREITEMEGVSAVIDCPCGLSMQDYDEGFYGKAEARAIEKWNNTCEKRMDVEAERKS